jgi:Uncharacterised nucleotidyltransferase
MQEPSSISTADAPGDEIEPGTAAFYRHVLETLNASAVPFLVGGAYAFNQYTGINRHTKDLDLFIYPSDYERVGQVLLQAGYETELTYPHWLAKVHSGGVYIDIIFSSGNGIAEVDEAWFVHAVETEVLGVPVKISPAEEMVWSKAFVMERERYDGADIAHLIRTCSGRLDWQRLLRRFEPHWRIFLNHLVLFGYIYPAHRDLVPAWLMNDLIERLQQEIRTPPPGERICAGTLLSRKQYLTDIEQWGYQDARLVPFGNMTAKDTATWTEAIQYKHGEP